MANQMFDRDVVGTLQSAATTGAGAGSAWYVPEQNGERPTRFAVQLIPSGTVSANSTVIEGSLDGSNWATLATYTDTTSVVKFIVDAPVRFIRANQGTITGGGNVTVLAQPTSA
jgi:hypothetical protein